MACSMVLVGLLAVVGLLGTTMGSGLKVLQNELLWSQALLLSCGG
ncbi:hypothetical protein CFP56_030549 [Quercus suber]|uniref:Uncharacterized protein n=1 Tax=Quercus suber TaxID=58331 RepID=A0AAW0JPR6_QUESU